MKTRKLTVWTERGTFTRRTHRPYTHIVVYCATPVANGRTTWHSSVDLAEKAVQASVSWHDRWLANHPDDEEYRRDFFRPEIYPIVLERSPA